MCAIGVCSRPCSAVVEIGFSRMAPLSHESDQDAVYAAARLSILVEGGMPANSCKPVGSRQVTVVP